MKVVYVKNDRYISLTINKTYEVIEDGIYNYKIIFDNGNEWWFPKIYFKPLSEIRNEKIDKLLKNES
jgi:hypothetical protein